jgi:Tfp pilus assembly protein PilF
MKIPFRVMVLFLLACFLPISMMAKGGAGGGQGGYGPAGMTVNNDPYLNPLILQKTWLVSGKVKTADGDPVRNASVLVAPLIRAASRTVTTNPQGEFRTEFQVILSNEQDVLEFSAIITAKAKGFHTAHAYVNYGHSGKTWEIPLTLHGMEEDPDLLSSSDLISALTPKLKHLGPEDGLGAKGEKEYTRSVAEYFDQNKPDQAVPRLFKVLGDNSSCVGCKTMLGLMEMGWFDWDDAYNNIAESVNASLHDRKMGRPEPLATYGTWLNWQHDPEKAEPFFLEALKFSPHDALALQELGRTRLFLQEFEGANDALKKALAAGAGPEARLLYVQSWLGLGRSDEAAAEMSRFLDGRDVNKMPIRVRRVYASVQSREKVETRYAQTKPKKKGYEPADFLQHPPAEMVRGLEPATDQAQLTPILDAAGAKILELIKNFPNTSSLESIHQEKLGRTGGVHDEQNEKFRYLCMVPREAGQPGFLEYRADLSGNAAVPKGVSEGFMLTTGFASTTFVFHPLYRSESTFRFLGRQNVNGRNTFVVAFAQIPGKARLNGNFQTGQTLVTTLSQGLAWIDPDSYEILRLHTELLAPLPELRLRKETLNIDFNAVHFTHLQETLWLPKQVTVTLDWNGKVLRNRHEYSDFKIFNVEASEKMGKPKDPTGTSQLPQDAPVIQ